MPVVRKQLVDAAVGLRGQWIVWPQLEDGLRFLRKLPLLNRWCRDNGANEQTQADGAQRNHDQIRDLRNAARERS